MADLGSRRSRLSGLVAPVAVLAVAGFAFAVTGHRAEGADAGRSAVPDTVQPAASVGTAWVGSWSTTPVIGGTGFADQTLREIVHTSLGGDAVRIRLTNAFGTGGLAVDRVTVGLRDSGATLRPGTEHDVTFGGAQRVVLPAGAEEFSDPVRLAVGPEQDLAVSLYVSAPTGPATRHPGAYTTSYVASGDHAADEGAGAFGSTTASWYLLDGVDVQADPGSAAVVTLGDSITDGTHSTVDADNRYPDFLARRLLAAGHRLGVLNEGASGNRLLTDAGGSGVNAQQRFDRDVVAQTGVRDVILLEGINDIGHNLGAVSGSTMTAQDVIDALANIAREAHEHGLRILGATLLPIGGSKYDSPEAEAKRQAVNQWIRTTDVFDGVVDFDRAVRDPADPSRILPQYDSGDELHPNDKGYQVMADAIDLSLLYR